MNEINEALLWRREHPYYAGLIIAWVVLTAIGHIKLSEATARRWPRFFALVMLGRDAGLYLARAIRPLVGLIAPGAIKHLLDAVYPSTPLAAARSTQAAPPGEMKGPLRDPAPSLVDPGES